MAVTSVVRIDVNFDGDITFGQQFETAASVTSPGMNEVKALTSGNNTITVPSGATGVTLIPPDNNEETITLKGVNGDTGIAIGLVNPMFLSLEGVSSFVINVGDDLSLRLIWS